MEDSSGTADEGSGGVDFIFMDAQVIQADFLKIKAFGLDADRVLLFLDAAAIISRLMLAATTHPC